MEQTLVQEMYGGFTQFLGFLNWTFIIVFYLFAWLTNDLTDATNTAKWLNWFRKLPKFFRSLLIGLILIVVFAYFFKFNTREDYFSMTVSLFFSMGVYKIGVDKVFKFVSKKLNIKIQ